MSGELTPPTHNGRTPAGESVEESFRRPPKAGEVSCKRTGRTGATLDSANGVRTGSPNGRLLIRSRTGSTLDSGRAGVPFAEILRQPGQKSSKVMFSSGKWPYPGV